MNEKETIYLDHNATSPCCPDHLKQVFEIYAECAGNPSSSHHVGRRSSVALTQARRNVAEALRLEPGEVIFVSGASEGNNLATVGVLLDKGPLHEQHAITSMIEHASVYQPLQQCKDKQGLQLTLLNPCEHGVLKVENIIEQIKPSTTLVALMAANNEVGNLLPVKEFGDWLQAKRWGAKENAERMQELDKHLDPKVNDDHLKNLHFHVDAVQAFGKVPPSQWWSLGLDSLTVTAHKLGGLPGIGVLGLRRGRKYYPLISGGSQERKRRAGTENLVGIISFGIVCQQVMQPEWWQEMDKVRSQTSYLKKTLAAVPAIRINSDEEKGLPNVLHFSITDPKVRSEDLLMRLDMEGICVGSGSACSSSVNLASRVLLALGRNECEALNVVRISLAPGIADASVQQAADILLRCLKG